MAVQSELTGRTPLEATPVENGTPVIVLFDANQEDSSQVKRKPRGKGLALLAIASALAERNTDGSFKYRSYRDKSLLRKVHEAKYDTLPEDEIERIMVFDANNATASTHRIESGLRNLCEGIEDPLAEKVLEAIHAADPLNAALSPQEALSLIPRRPEKPNGIPKEKSKTKKSPTASEAPTLDILGSIAEFKDSQVMEGFKNGDDEPSDNYLEDLPKLERVKGLKPIGRLQREIGINLFLRSDDGSFVYSTSSDLALINKVFPESNPDLPPKEIARKRNIKRIQARQVVISLARRLQNIEDGKQDHYANIFLEELKSLHPLNHDLIVKDAITILLRKKPKTKQPRETQPTPIITHKPQPETKPSLPKTESKKRSIPIGKNQRLVGLSMVERNEDGSFKYEAPSDNNLALQLLDEQALKGLSSRQISLKMNTSRFMLRQSAKDLARRIRNFANGESDSHIANLIEQMRSSNPLNIALTPEEIIDRLSSVKLQKPGRKTKTEKPAKEAKPKRIYAPATDAAKRLMSTVLIKEATDDEITEPVVITKITELPSMVPNYLSDKGPKDRRRKSVPIKPTRVKDIEKDKPRSSEPINDIEKPVMPKGKLHPKYQLAYSLLLLNEDGTNYQYPNLKDCIDDVFTKTLNSVPDEFRPGLKASLTRDSIGSLGEVIRDLRMVDYLLFTGAEPDSTKYADVQSFIKWTGLYNIYSGHSIPDLIDIMQRDTPFNDVLDAYTNIERVKKVRTTDRAIEGLEEEKFGFEVEDKYIIATFLSGLSPERAKAFGINLIPDDLAGLSRITAAAELNNPQIEDLLNQHKGQVYMKLEEFFQDPTRHMKEIDDKDTKYLLRFLRNLPVHQRQEVMRQLAK